jgi:hypothetical protein
MAESAAAAFFKVLVDSASQATKVLTNLPYNEREAYRIALKDTFRLIDTTLNMVILRLGRARDLDDDSFRQETAQLDNQEGWMAAEREFRLCASVRIALRESETLGRRLVGPLVVKEWDGLLRNMKDILSSEERIAAYIVAKLAAVAQEARTGAISRAREQAEDLRNALIGEREQLIRAEGDLLLNV